MRELRERAGILRYERSARLKRTQRPAKEIGHLATLLSEAKAIHSPAIVYRTVSSVKQAEPSASRTE